MNKNIKIPATLSNIICELYIYLVLIKEGATISDKIAILSYLITAPLRLFFKISGRKYNRSFIHDVTLKNEYGRYFCDRSFTSCRIVSSLYEKDMRDSFVLKEGIFVDVGAHVGKYAIRLARMIGNNGKVVAIEPEPNNFKVLEKNVMLNDLKNVYLQNVACFDNNTEIALYVHDKYSTLHSLFKGDDQKKIDVKTYKLDTLLSMLKIKKVDFIKIDVEGAELSVIKGANKTLQAYHPRIIFEAFNEKSLIEIKKYLNKFNYDVKKIHDKNYFAY